MNDGIDAIAWTKANAEVIAAARDLVRVPATETPDFAMRLERLHVAVDAMEAMEREAAERDGHLPPAPIGTISRP